jgi:magnesium-transporting ATPase (P-type)
VTFYFEFLHSACQSTTHILSLFFTRLSQSPLHKVSVVSTFVEMGHITAMVGDGGNDCGALKAAHVGVALSDSEASIVSPFTSLDKAIDSVVDVLLEGRCALASALASYKYILMYGQIEGFDNLIMAFFRVNLTEYAWAFMDGLWVIGMSFTLPLAKAARRLAKTRPTSSVLSPITVASFSGVLAFNLLGHSTSKTGSSAASLPTRTLVT